jgi:hypothetical protein
MALGVIMLVVAGMLITPALIKWDRYKNHITELCHTLTKFDMKVIGNIEVQFLPYPKIILSDVYLSQLAKERESLNKPILQGTKVEVGFALLELLRGKLIANELVLKGGVINWDIQHNANLITSSQSGGHIKLSTVKLIDNDLTVSKGSHPVLKNLGNFSFQLSLKSKELLFKGYIKGDKEVINLEANLEKYKQDSQLSGKISSPSFIYTYQGQVTDIDSNWKLKGSTNLVIKNLDKVADYYFSKFFAGENIINSAESVDIKSDLYVTEQEATLSNLVIKSSNISASGETSYSMAETPSLNINLMVSSLNIDGLMADTSSQELREKKNEKLALSTLKSLQKTPSLAEKIEIPNDRNILLYISFKDTLLNKLKVNEAVINAELVDGQIELYDFSLNAQDNSKMGLTGTITSNNVRPIFHGDLFAFSDNFSTILTLLGYENYQISDKFNLKSKILAKPQEVNFFDIEAIIGNLDLDGNLAIRKYPGSIPHIDAELSLNSMDLDKYQVSPIVKSFLLSVFDKEEERFNNYSWLRNLKYELSIGLNVHSLIYNKNAISKFYSIIYLAPGIIKFDRIRLQSELSDFFGNVIFDVRALKPKVVLDLTGNLFDAKFFDLGVEEKKGSVIAENSNSKWSEKPFDFVDLTKLEGSIALKFPKFKWGNRELHDFNFEGLIQNDLLEIKAFKTNLFGGTVEVLGNILSSPLSLSLSFALYNASLKELLSTVIDDNVTGYISASGNFNTYGNSPSLWVSQAVSEVNFAAREINIPGFNLSKYTDIAREDYNPVTFAEEVNTAFRSGDTIFSSIDGKLRINKGFLTTEALTFNTKYISGAFNGNLDLKNWLLNSVCNFSFIPEIGQQPVNIDAKLWGSLNKLERTIDASQLENYLKSKPHSN